MKPDRPQVTM